MTLAIWLLSFFLPPAPATAPAPVEVVHAPLAAISYAGFWLMEDQDAVVEITRQGDTYMGRFVAFRKDAANAKKSLLNTTLLKELKPDGDDLAGKILDPKSGKDYKVTLVYTGPKTLEMRVKVMGVVAHKETWTRQASAK